ncbi:hypothetical protein JF540_01525 [Salipiger thiooxidans]|uniref:hypothetical protein n=1 Tax=Salipiger thiooxidans TaxID=282683 RepID=UPI001A8F88BB|nr:hypothetical protein [Salipiger thiooxidans]MBN8185359.1 hypothetical protein [Salipiger thiooxidans]
MTGHLADSETMIASLVAYLAEQGVRRSEFTVLDLGLEADRENVSLFIDALKWLASEGIVRSQDTHEFYSVSEGDTAASGFTLTSYGFALLQQPFLGELTLGGAIKKAQGSGSGYSGIGDLVGGILGGFTKSLSS